MKQKQKTAAAKGRCFVDSYLAIMKGTAEGLPEKASDLGLTLVHGKVKLDNGKIGDHAWLEFATPDGKWEFVWESQQQRVFDKKTFYASLQPRVTGRFTRAQALQLRNEAKHCGPWGKQASLLKKADVPENLQKLNAPVSKEYDMVQRVYAWYIANNVDTLPWRDFQKWFPFAQNSPLFTQIRHNKPQVTEEDLRAWLTENQSTTNYEVDYSTYNNAEHSFRDVEQLVLQINRSADATRILNQDPVLKKYVDYVGQSSNMSEHPAGMSTVGWLRVDFVNDEWLLIDEVQSDLINSVTQAKAIVDNEDFDSFVENIQNEKVKQLVLENLNAPTFAARRQYFIQQGYNAEKLNQIKNKLAELFQNWAEYGIATLLEIARKHGIKNVAIHTVDTIGQRDEFVEADKVKMYYDNLAKSFGFKKQQVDVGNLKGNFWVRTAAIKPVTRDVEIERLFRKWVKSPSVQTAYDEVARKWHANNEALDEAFRSMFTERYEWLKYVLDQLAPVLHQGDMFPDSETNRVVHYHDSAARWLRKSKEELDQKFIDNDTLRRWLTQAELTLDFIVSQLHDSHTVQASKTADASIAKFLKKWDGPDKTLRQLKEEAISTAGCQRLGKYTLQLFTEFRDEVTPLLSNRSLFFGFEMSFANMAADRIEESLYHLKRDVAKFERDPMDWETHDSIERESGKLERAKNTIIDSLKVMVGPKQKVTMIRGSKVADVVDYNWGNENEDEDYIDDEQMEIPTFTIPAGTILYHGTDSAEWNPKEEDISTPAWFSRSRSVAQYFSKWRQAKKPVIIVYRTTQPIELPEVSTKQELEYLLEQHGAGSTDPVDIEDSSLFGWIIPNNYPDGDDIMLTDTSALQIEHIETLNGKKIGADKMLVDDPKRYSEVRRDPRQTSIFGPEHEEELQDMYAKPKNPFQSDLLKDLGEGEEAQGKVDDLLNGSLF